MDNFDEIIFKHKNKTYGAYILRKRYDKNLSMALLITVVIFIALSIYITYISVNIDQFTGEQLRQEIAEYEQFTMLKDVDTLMVQVSPPKKVSENMNTVPLIVDSIKPQIDTMRTIKLPDKKLDSIKTDKKSLSDSIRNGTANGNGSADVFVMASLPVFPGGNENIKKFIKENTKYPEEAYKANIKGIVIIEYTVNALGYVTDVKVSKSVHPLLDKEALRVVKLFPKFTPARTHGRAIKLKLYQKFNFG